MALHCQYVPVSLKALAEAEDGHSHMTDSRLKFGMGSQNSSMMLSSPPPRESSFSFQASSRIRSSSYYPFSMHAITSFSDNPDTLRSNTDSIGDTGGLYAKGSGKSNSVHTVNRTNAETRSALLEKCIPLMRDHYCVDEICYLLSISHSTFWDMVNETPKQFQIFYVVSNRWCVCWCYRRFQSAFISFSFSSSPLSHYLITSQTNIPKRRKDLQHLTVDSSSATRSCSESPRPPE